LKFFEEKFRKMWEKPVLFPHFSLKSIFAIFRPIYAETCGG
jgi:hypothetical protein